MLGYVNTEVLCNCILISLTSACLVCLLWWYFSDVSCSLQTELMNGNAGLRWVLKKRIVTKHFKLASGRIWREHSTGGPGAAAATRGRRRHQRHLPRLSGAVYFCLLTACRALCCCILLLRGSMNLNGDLNAFDVTNQRGSMVYTKMRMLKWQRRSESRVTFPPPPIHP